MARITPREEEPEEEKRPSVSDRVKEKRKQSAKRPLGRPLPARGAAREKREEKKTSAPSSRPAPALGVARLPKTRASLYSRYGIVFDPSSENTAVTERELDSLMDLYRRSTGQELDSKGNVRQALERAGLIGKPKGRLTAPAENLFASAADALDWFDRNAGPYVSDQAILGGARRGLDRLGVRGDADALTVASPILSALRTGPTREPLLRGIETSARGVGRGIERITPFVRSIQPQPLGRRGVGAPEALRQTQEGGDLGAISDLAGDMAENPNAYVRSSGVAQLRNPDGTPRVSDPELRKAINDLREEGVPGYVVTQRLRDIRDSYFTPNDLKAMRGMAAENGWEVNNWNALTLDEKIYRAATKKDYLTEVGRSVVRTFGELGSIPASAKMIAEAIADAAGGDTENAKLLLEAAVSPYTYWNRNRQQVGIWQASLDFFRDNPLEFALALNFGLRTASRTAGIAARAQSFSPRLSEYAQAGRPVFVKGPEINVPPQPRPVPRPEGLSIPELGARQRLVEANRRAQEEFLRTGVGETVRPEVRIGVTSKRLFKTFMIATVRRSIASKSNRYRRVLENVGLGGRRPFDPEFERGFRDTRRASAEIAGIKADVDKVFFRTLGNVSQGVRERVAFNLIWGKYTVAGMEILDAARRANRPLTGEEAARLAGEEITPNKVADFFEAELDKTVRGIEDSGRAPTVEQRNAITRLENEVAYYRALNDFEVDPEKMAKLREAVKPYGELGVRVVAEDISYRRNIDIKTAHKEANRNDFIRYRLFDPDLEKRSQRLYRTRNAAVRELYGGKGRVGLERQIATASRRFQKQLSKSGWGRAGRAESVKRFAKELDKLILLFERAENAARRAGLENKADEYAARRSELEDVKERFARDQEAAVEEARRIENFELSETGVAALRESVRTPYERALEADARAAKLREERAAALEEVGVRRVTERTTEQARERAARTEREIEALEGLPEPPAARVSSLRERLRGERESYEARGRALERVRKIDQEVVALRKERANYVREMKRQANEGKVVFSSGVVTTTLSTTKRSAVVRDRSSGKDLYYTIERARNETLDEYIARLRANDMHPVLHLVQSPELLSIGGRARAKLRGERVDPALRTDPRGGFIDPRRFYESDGLLFQTGQESAKMWMNLIDDTRDLASSAGWRRALTRLIEGYSIAFTFNDDVLAAAAKMVRETPELRRLADAEGEAAAVLEALQRTLFAKRGDYNLNDWVVINLQSPKAVKGKDSVSVGKAGDKKEIDASDFFRETIDMRMVDPDAPGTFYLVPRHYYDGIVSALQKENFKIPRGSFAGKVDVLVRHWRNFTLNIFLRTFVNNFAGSGVLAAMYGVSPYAVYLAASAIVGKPIKTRSGKSIDLEYPLELRQRWMEQITAPTLTGTGRKAGRLTDQAYTQLAFGPVAWWMNTLRTLNGASEDFWRLSIYFDQAIPEAARLTGRNATISKMRRLTDEMVDALDQMAEGNPKYRVATEQFIQTSIDFIGDLRRGGAFASYIRIAIPFWQWYAHIVKFTLYTMPFKYPGRQLFLTELSQLAALYQEKYGMSLPYGADFVPFGVTSFESDGEIQEYVKGLSTNAWYPAGTVAPLALRTGEDVAVVPFFKNMVTPIFVSAAEILASLATGEAKKFSDREGDVFEAARDEYGLVIDKRLSKAFARYVANRLFRSIPLAPSLMSEAGRSDTALPIPGLMSPKLSTSGMAVPEQLREGRRGDVASIVKQMADGSWDKAGSNALTFLGRFVSLSYGMMPGAGPMRRDRLARDWKYSIDKKNREERQLLKALIEIHERDDREFIERGKLP